MRFIYSIKDRCIYTQILNAFEFDLEHNGTIKHKINERDRYD